MKRGAPLTRRTPLVAKTELRRSTPLSGGCALERRTELRKTSAKRQREQRQYSSKRTVFLAEHPRCEFPLGCRNAASDVHHKAGRVGALYLDDSRWAALCRSCHDWTTRNPAAAYELGISERRVS